MDYGQHSDWLTRSSAEFTSQYLGFGVCGQRRFAQWSPSNHAANTRSNHHEAKAALEINTTKTKAASTLNVWKLFINGEWIQIDIPQVPGIGYGKVTDEIVTTIDIARTAFLQLQWVLWIRTYGCETCHSKSGIAEGWNYSIVRCLQRILRINREEWISNKEIRMWYCDSERLSIFRHLVSIYEDQRWKSLDKRYDACPVLEWHCR